MPLTVRGVMMPVFFWDSHRQHRSMLKRQEKI
jgi:hypothetical protein